MSDRTLSSNSITPSSRSQLSRSRTTQFAGNAKNYRLLTSILPIIEKQKTHGIKPLGKFRPSSKSAHGPQRFHGSISQFGKTRNPSMIKDLNRKPTFLRGGDFESEEEEDLEEADSQSNPIVSNDAQIPTVPTLPTVSLPVISSQGRNSSTGLFLNTQLKLPDEPTPKSMLLSEQRLEEFVDEDDNPDDPFRSNSSVSSLTSRSGLSASGISGQVSPQLIWTRSQIIRKKSQAPMKRISVFDNNTIYEQAENTPEAAPDDIEFEQTSSNYYSKKDSEKSPMSGFRHMLSLSSQKMPRTKMKTPRVSQKLRWLQEELLAAQTSARRRKPPNEEQTWVTKAGSVVVRAASKIFPSWLIYLVGLNANIVVLGIQEKIDDFLKDPLSTFDHTQFEKEQADKEFVFTALLSLFFLLNLAVLTTAFFAGKAVAPAWFAISQVCGLVISICSSLQIFRQLQDLIQGSSLAPLIESLQQQVQTTARRFETDLRVRASTIVSLALTQIVIPPASSSCNELKVFGFLGSYALQQFYINELIESQAEATLLVPVVEAINFFQLSCAVHHGEGFGMATKLVVLFSLLIAFTRIQTGSNSIFRCKQVHFLQLKNQYQKSDFQSILQNCPQGMMIYTLNKQGEEEETPGFEQQSSIFSAYSTHPGPKPSKVTVKFHNSQLVQLLNPFGLNADSSVAKLMNGKFFRQVKYSKVDGSTRLRQSHHMSLKEILQAKTEKDKQMFFQFETNLEVTRARGNEDGAYDSSTELASSAAYLKHIIHMEVTIKEVDLEFSKCRLIILQNINHVISNQSMKMHSDYQEAVTATISHEQMNPLNSIINFSRYLYNKTEEHLSCILRTESNFNDMSAESHTHTDPEEDRLVEITKSDLESQLNVAKIVYCSSMMMKLLNQAMLNSTLIKQGKYEPHYKVIRSPFRIIKNFVSLFDCEIKQKNLKFTLNDSIQGKIQIVKRVQMEGMLLDQALFEQILYNVFTNACKFNRTNGEIKMSFSVHKYQQEGIKTPKERERIKVIVEVQDTGIGMDYKTKKGLFKVFESVKQNAMKSNFDEDRSNEGQTKPTTQGFGLGLYLSKQLCQYMLGDIRIESEPNVGTTVKVIFVSRIARKQNEDSSRRHREILIEQLQQSTDGLDDPLQQRNRSEVVDAMLSGRAVQNPIEQEEMPVRKHTQDINLMNKKRRSASKESLFNRPNRSSLKSQLDQSVNLNDEIDKLVPKSEISLEDRRSIVSNEKLVKPYYLINQSQQHESSRESFGLNSVDNMAKRQSTLKRIRNSNVDVNPFSPRFSKLINLQPKVSLGGKGNQGGVDSMGKLQRTVTFAGAKKKQMEGHDLPGYVEQQKMDSFKSSSESSEEAKEESQVDQPISGARLTFKASEASELPSQAQIGHIGGSITPDYNGAVPTYHYTVTTEGNESSSQLNIAQQMEQYLLETKATLSFEEQKNSPATRAHSKPRTQSSPQKARPSISKGVLGASLLVPKLEEIKEQNEPLTSMILTSRLSSSQMSSNKDDQNSGAHHEVQIPNLRLVDVSSSSSNRETGESGGSGDSGESYQQQVFVQQRSHHRISIHELDEQTPHLNWSLLSSDHGFSQVSASVQEKKSAESEEVKELKKKLGEAIQKMMQKKRYILHQINETDDEIESKEHSVKDDSIERKRTSSFPAVTSGKDFEEEKVTKAPKIQAAEQLDISKRWSVNDQSNLQKLEGHLNLPPLEQRSPQVSYSLQQPSMYISSPAMSQQRYSEVSGEFICRCKKSPILIVDDNAFNLETLKLIIKEKYHFIPDTAVNGQEAFDKFKVNHDQDPESDRSTLKKKKKQCSLYCQKQFYHLIFMDLNMPVMDGFESTRKILEYQKENSVSTSARFANPGRPKACKIIALTAFVNSENIEKCEKVKMEQVLNKPASSSEIVAAINKHCPFLPEPNPSPRIVSPS